MEKKTRLVLNNHEEIVGYPEVWDGSNPDVHPFLWGRLQPTYEHTGIGSEILKWSIDRSKHVIKRVPEGVRATARPLPSVPTKLVSVCWNSMG